jgi:UDP-4-amino-4,6-dideoxy-N-acetyl-beta-L-altrosamine N-acetyltransferase
MASKGVLLRRVETADLPQILQWRNHPEIRNYMLTQREIEWEEHQRWFSSAAIDRSRRLLMVEEDGVPLGFVQFTGVIPDGSADWGFYAAPQAPKGSGKKLGLAALDHAFGSLQLHKVCGQALAFNSASIRMHEALGFVREGTLREQHRLGDRYHNLICFGYLRAEWEAANKDQP